MESETSCHPGVSVRRSHPSEEVLIMKMLFSLKNKLSPKKSLKAYAWYLWY